MLLLRACVATCPGYLARTLHFCEEPGDPAPRPDAPRSHTASLFADWDRRVRKVVAAWCGASELQPDACTALHLPVRMGGVGVRAIQDLADQAFTASVFDCCTTYESRHHRPLLLSASTRARIASWIGSSELPPLQQGQRALFDQGVLPPLSRPNSARGWQATLQGIVDRRTPRPGADNDALRFLAIDTSAPATWLTVAPTEAAFALTDNDFSTLLAARLLITPTSRLDQPPHMTCPLCRRSFRSWASHPYTCRSVAGWIEHRHRHVVDLLHARLPGARKEALLSLSTNSNPTPTADSDADYRRMDLLLPGTAGKPVAVDATIVAAGRADRRPHDTLARAHAKKQTKYACFERAAVVSHLVTFACGPFGNLSKMALTLLADRLPDRHVRRDVTRRVALGVARGTARTIQAWSYLFNRRRLTAGSDPPPPVNPAPRSYWLAGTVHRVVRRW
jgi:hypothetical protein